MCPTAAGHTAVLISGPSMTEPLDAVAVLAETAANQRGLSLVGSGLRLFEGRRAVPVGDAASRVSPFDLGRAYELLLAPKARRKKGAHLTPEGVARNLVAMMPPPALSDRVLDPAVGGAAFLIAAADQLVDGGARPAEVIRQLFGVDIDAGAVAVAEAALALWGIDHEVEVRPLPNLSLGDGLLHELPVANRVVGNPPFLNQLRSSSTHTAARRTALRERWGDLVGTYTDDAWLFIAAGLHALDTNGTLAMVQPVSVLAARYGDAVREHVAARASLLGIWLAREQVFDAAVQVCGLVLGTGSSTAATVERRVGADFSTVPTRLDQPAPSEWGSTAAAAMEVPEVRLLRGASRTISDLASATAGFRDQFYGFVPHVSEWDSDVVPATHARLVTVGMIDVLELGWGSRPFKFAKQSYRRPVIDLAALYAENDKLGQWVRARQRPKLLMATQTRVVEVWVDESGQAIPATPVVSIEPLDDDPEALWLLAAALSAPALSAHFMANNFGTAMSLNAMKLSARDVLGAPLPSDHGAWTDAATTLRSNPGDTEYFAEIMDRAYGAADASVASWWTGRLANQSKK